MHNYLTSNKDSTAQHTICLNSYHLCYNMGYCYVLFSVSANRLAPSDFIAGHPKAALLFCLLLILFFSLFLLARFIAVVSIVSVCLVSDFSIVATCHSMSAARFVFCLCFIRFGFVLSGEPKQNQGRGLVDRKLVQAPPPPPPPQ